MKTSFVNKKKPLSIWSHLSTLLCGLKMEVKKSSSSELEGIKGIIEDETTNLIKLRTDKNSVWIPKKDQIFEIVLEDGSIIIIEGRILLGKPENRVKKKLKKW